ncbi:MAG TPA: MG2 domain-containing protein, partial [Chitinophagaceae bacterium]|nr:MG2 domain-containing protein [Chitinophagaceae bacterium]
METHSSLPLAKRLAIIACVAIFFSCNSKPKIIDVDPAFGKYIDAYTSGVISKKNSIRIHLAADANTTHTLNETVKETLFEFSPSVSGKAYWADARTVEFKPDADLKPDAIYTVSFALQKVMDVPAKYGEFAFNVQVAKPSFQINDFGLKSNDKTHMTFTGELVTADEETSASVEKILSASLNSSDIKISWQHNEAGKTHGFTISNIVRGNAAGKLVLNWDGASISSDIKGNEEIAVPASGDFIVLDVKAVQDNEQYALVQFSDPLDNSQPLDGLITVNEQENVSFTILGSEVKVYTSSQLDGDYSVNIHEGIHNQWGDKLLKAYASNIYFVTSLPSVKILGRGVILPGGSGKLLLPFEATNLKAVDVSIIKIYENNIVQFLQDNNLNGSSSLRRVGKPLVQATVQLDDDKSLNLHKKNRFSLDLDKYIKTEPGALYRIDLGFRPDYSLYTCDSMQEDDDGYYYGDYYGDDDRSVDDDNDFWYRYNDYYPYGYNWEQRDNPCYKSYYNKEHFDSRNILASNIGLTAKRGNDNSLFVAVNNIIDTKPISDVELQVLDYQQQVIGSAKSSSDGIAMIDIKRKPYLLIAKQGNERGYLKLDDGISLPLSRFDVDGAEVKNGIKGFIFGERGVWRPGDSLFLSCIIENKEHNLPDDFPLEMELVTPRGQLYKRIVQKLSADNFNVFRTVTDADAPTGNWICRIKAGGATFEKQLKIETVMPNRLKIDLNFGNLDALGKNATTNGTLNAKWLFGATAQNLKARVDAQLYRRTTSFPKFKDYVFDDPTVSFTAQSKTIFDGTLSAEGTAVINPAFDVSEKSPGQLLANMVVKVFEPGGNFSTDNFSMPYNPYSSYIGVHVPDGDKTWGFLQSGKSHRFDIADVDTKGNTVNGTTQAEVSVYKIQWRWWWDET